MKRPFWGVDASSDSSDLLSADKKSDSFEKRKNFVGCLHTDEIEKAWSLEASICFVFSS